jgi:hypothetical protein
VTRIYVLSNNLFSYEYNNSVHKVVLGINYLWVHLGNLCITLGTHQLTTVIFPKGQLVKVFGAEVFKFDYHDIKTFADACEKLGMKEHLLTGSMGGDREAQGQAQALYKLLIIQKAMNNNVWRDKDGWSYYPYWVLYSKEEMKRMSEEEKQRKGIKQLLSCALAIYTESAGVRCASAVFRGAPAVTNSGFPLCFNSEEAALYAAKQFESLFFDYYGIKVKEG